VLRFVLRLLLRQPWLLLPQTTAGRTHQLLVLVLAQVLVQRQTCHCTASHHRYLLLLV